MRDVVATRVEADSLLAWHAQQRRAIADELASLDSARLSAEIAGLLAAAENYGKPAIGDVHAPDGGGRARWKHR